VTCQPRDGPENDEREEVRALNLAGCALGVLHRRQEGECRLRTLIEIGAGSLQAVEPSACVCIPHEDTSVISTEEPICGAGESDFPVLAAVNFEGADTGIGESRRLNRLLIEPGIWVSGGASPDRSHREMSASRLTSHEPFEELQAAPLERRSIEGRAGRDHRFGQNCVCVRKAWFGPRPT